MNNDLNEYTKPSPRTGTSAKGRIVFSYVSTSRHTKDMVAEYVDPGFQAKLDEKDRIELEQAEFKVEANLYPDRFRKILKCNGELVYIRK